MKPQLEAAAGTAARLRGGVKARDACDASLFMVLCLVSACSLFRSHDDVDQPPGTTMTFFTGAPFDELLHVGVRQRRRPICALVGVLRRHAMLPRSLPLTCSTSSISSCDQRALVDLRPGRVEQVAVLARSRVAPTARA